MTPSGLLSWPNQSGYRSSHAKLRLEATSIMTSRPSICSG